MKKPIILFAIAGVLILLSVLLLFSGCAEVTVYGGESQPAVEKTETDSQQSENSFGDYFELVARDSWGDFSIYRDRKTDVLYCWRKSGYGAGLTVMVSPDGSPLLYSEWLEMPLPTE